MPPASVNDGMATTQVVDAGLLVGEPVPEEEEPPDESPGSSVGGAIPCSVESLSPPPPPPHAGNNKQAAATIEVTDNLKGENVCVFIVRKIDVPYNSLTP